MTAHPKGRTAPLHPPIASARPLLGIVLLGSVALLGGHAEAADNGQGAQIAAACASCHDPTGGDRGIPPIVGLAEQKIIAAMDGYRASELPSHVMHAVALSLTDEELASVARYLAAQATGSNPQ
jgi:cytochrome c553